MDEWNKEIEKFWRDKFADEIENSLAHLVEGFDTETEWFNKGMSHAAFIIRYRRDE